MEPSERALGPFDAGLLLGVLVGEGHFGGDGRQPHVVLRLHTRHEPLFHWLKARFPYARLYGPYHHSGRSYFQFMWRGTALRYGLMPLLEALPWAEIDPHSYERYQTMKQQYGLGDVPSPALAPLSASPRTGAASRESPRGGESAPASGRPSPE